MGASWATSSGGAHPSSGGANQTNVPPSAYYPIALLAIVLLAERASLKKKHLISSHLLNSVPFPRVSGLKRLRHDTMQKVRVAEGLLLSELYVFPRNVSSPK